MRLGLLIFVGVLATLSFSLASETSTPLGFASAVLQQNQNQTLTITYQSTGTRALNYSSGYYDGYYDGFKDGYRSGYKDGYSAGYNDGFNGRQPDIAKANQDIHQLNLIIEGLGVLLTIFIVLSIALYSHRRHSYPMQEAGS